MELDFKQWLGEWREKRLKAPWFLIVRIDEQFKEGDDINVVAFPHIDQRDEMGCFDLPRYKGKGYEIPVCLLNEPLTKSNANQLRTALKIIKMMQGIEANHGISFMMQVAIIYEDFCRAKKEKKSILEGLQPADIPEENRQKIVEKAMNTPGFSMEKILHFWHEIGGRIAGGFLKKPTDFLGMPNYAIIPPGWIKINDYKETLKEGEQLPKITSAIDPLDFQLLPLLKGLSEYAAFNAGREPAQINEQEHEPEGVEKIEPSNFKNIKLKALDKTAFEIAKALMPDSRPLTQETVCEKLKALENEFYYFWGSLLKHWFPHLIASKKYFYNKNLYLAVLEKDNTPVAAKFLPFGDTVARARWENIVRTENAWRGATNLNAEKIPSGHPRIKYICIINQGETPKQSIATVTRDRFPNIDEIDTRIISSLGFPNPFSLLLEGKASEEIFKNSRDCISSAEFWRKREEFKNAVPMSLPPRQTLTAGMVCIASHDDLLKVFADTGFLTRDYFRTELPPYHFRDGEKRDEMTTEALIFKYANTFGFDGVNKASGEFHEQVTKAVQNRQEIEKLRLVDQKWIKISIAAGKAKILLDPGLIIEVRRVLSDGQESEQKPEAAHKEATNEIVSELDGIVKQIKNGMAAEHERMAEDIRKANEVHLEQIRRIATDMASQAIPKETFACIPNAAEVAAQTFARMPNKEMMKAAEAAAKTFARIPNEEMMKAAEAAAETFARMPNAAEEAAQAFAHTPMMAAAQALIKAFPEDFFDRTPNEETFKAAEAALKAIPEEAIDQLQKMAALQNDEYIARQKKLVESFGRPILEQMLGEKSLHQKEIDRLIESSKESFNSLIEAESADARKHWEIIAKDHQIQSSSQTPPSENDNYWLFRNIAVQSRRRELSEEDVRRIFREELENDRKRKEQNDGKDVNQEPKEGGPRGARGENNIKAESRETVQESGEIKINTIDEIPLGWIICKYQTISFFIQRIERIKSRAVSNRFAKNEYKDKAQRFSEKSHFLKQHVALNQTFYENIIRLVDQMSQPNKVKSAPFIKDLKDFCKEKSKFIAFYYEKFPLKKNTA